MIKAIVCIGANGVMGKDGTMPWGDQPLDGRHFRSLTEGHAVVMGRKTFESIGDPLPNRMNIVLTSRYVVNANKARPFVDYIYTAKSVEEVLDVYDRSKPGVDLWVIGGSSVYEQFLPYIEEFYVTTVGESFDGDTFFPNIFEDHKWKSELIGSDIINIPKRREPGFYTCVGSEIVTKPATIQTDTYHLLYRKFTKKSVTEVYRDMYSKDTP